MTTDTMVDTRDMIVHTALLRERRLAPRLVERDGTHAREHGAFLLDLLEHTTSPAASVRTNTGTQTGISLWASRGRA